MGSQPDVGRRPAPATGGSIARWAEFRRTNLHSDGRVAALVLTGYETLLSRVLSNALVTSGGQFLPAGHCARAKRAAKIWDTCAVKLRSDAMSTRLHDRRRRS